MRGRIIHPADTGYGICQTLRICPFSSSRHLSYGKTRKRSAVCPPRVISAQTAYVKCSAFGRLRFEIQAEAVCLFLTPALPEKANGRGRTSGVMKRYPGTVSCKPLRVRTAGQQNATGSSGHRLTEKKSRPGPKSRNTKNSENVFMKKDFNRTDSLFSLCGLNCGLCPMQIRGECSGCFNGSTCYKTCPIAPCSVRHGNVEYCFQCGEYPCSRYDGIDKYDSLISHRNQKKDLAKAKETGIEAYLAQQRAKKEILTRILKDYDDGNRLVFFCLAVNMMDTADLKEVLAQTDPETAGLSLRGKAERLETLLRDRAARKGISLALRPWQNS